MRPATGKWRGNFPGYATGIRGGVNGSPSAARRKPDGRFHPSTAAMLRCSVNIGREDIVIEKKSTGIKGGARPGAGRKKGVPNKKTAETQRAVEESGVTPLDFMLNVMRSELPAGLEGAALVQAMNLRFEAAKAAAPYVHARLSSVDLNAKISPHEASLDELA